MLGRLALLAGLGAAAACADDSAADTGAASSAGAAGTGAGGASAGVGGAGGASGSTSAGGAGASGGSTCDPVAQTCAPGAASKCTLVTINGKNTTGCVDDHGTAGEGEACKRDTDGPAGFGHDDCAKGLFCTFIGVLPPSAGGTRRCRTLCHADGSCPATQRCAALDDAKPANGFCGVTCEPFGTSCAAGLECSRLWAAADPAGPAAFLTCRLPGAKPAGAACDAVAEDCVAGHVCVDPILGQSPSCLPLCDAKHPCAKGSCVMPGGGSAGVCLQ